MIKTCSWHIGILAICCVTLASPQALAQNLVNNPGFESQMMGWSTSTGSAVYTATTNGVLNGTYSAQGVEPGNSLGRLYQNFTGALAVGKKYKISGWIKTQDVTGQGVVLALNYVDADGWTQAGHRVMEIAYAKGATDWTHYESPWFELPVMPADAVALWLLFDFNAGAGTAFFDDVSLIRQPDVDYFVTTWKTDNPGASSPTSITVPMVGGPYEVDWDNDGNFDETGLNGPVTHDFGVAGTYMIRVNGTYDSIRFEDGGDKEKILSLDQWGTRAWVSMALAFQGAVNLQVPATDVPDFSAVTDMYGMFWGATSANPDTSDWDMAAVENMSWMFASTYSANPDTSGWDTSAVVHMYSMFYNATSANPDTSGWNTAAVANMAYMFYGATSANPDTSGWDTAAVLDMSYMFVGATSANPDTSNWNTSAVTNMAKMFSGATSANPNTSGWDTSSVTDMSYMFARATSANPDTSGWNTSAVTTMSALFGWATSTIPDTSSWDTAAVLDMSSMFYQAISANPNTSGWNTSAVTDMEAMFAGATSAKPDTSGWDTRSVTNMVGMFDGATSANPNTSGWDTSAVKDMDFMFYGATSANPNTSGWDTGAVTSTFGMFMGATSFDQDLGAWNVTSLIDATDMFAGVTLSTENYESLLIGWNTQVLQTGVTFSGGNSIYCSEAAIAARASMIDSSSWVITDGGLCPPPEPPIFKDSFESQPPGTECPCFTYEDVVEAANPDRLWFNCLNFSDPQSMHIWSWEIAHTFGPMSRTAARGQVSALIDRGTPTCNLDSNIDWVPWEGDPGNANDMLKYENCVSKVETVIDEFTLDCETERVCRHRVQISDPVVEGTIVTINGALINSPPDDCVNNAPIAKVIWWWWDGQEVFEPNPNDGYVYTFPNSHATNEDGNFSVDIVAYDAAGRVIDFVFISDHGD